MRTVTAALAILAAAGACGSKHDSPPAPAQVTHAVAAGKTWPIASEEVALTVGARTIPATVARPDAPGAWPALLLMAGSGPTDRDWNSPLIPTRNGSGRLLAEALAAHGVVVIRWDKAGSSKANPGPPLPAYSLDTYTDEAKAALAYVQGRADVRKDAIFVAGHSEGGIHATRLAQQAGGAIRGVIFLSAAGRRMVDIMEAQLEGNFRDQHFTPDSIAAQMAKVKGALDDFLAGKPVDPAAVSQFPGVQQLVRAIVNPPTATLSRALISFDPAAEAAKLPQRDVFVGGGGKDVQVDPALDAARLVAAMHQAGKTVTLHVSPDMDHVLKHEPRSLDDIHADMLATQNAYNAPGRGLDDDFVAALVAWLAAHT